MTKSPFSSLLAVVLVLIAGCGKETNINNNVPNAGAAGTAGIAGESGAGHAGTGGSFAGAGNGGTAGGGQGGSNPGGSAGSAADGGTGGTGGEGGSAGVSGEGGSGGDAGTAGTGGTSGTSGNAGNAGTAGTAGTAGNAGSAGTGAQNSGYTLSTTTGDDQTAYIAQALQPIILKLVDSQNHAVKNHPLTVTAPAGVGVTPTELTTDILGEATLLVRLGLEQGPLEISVSSDDVAPVTLHFTATAPPDGSVFTILNAIKDEGTPTSFPNAATMFPVKYAIGLAVGDDGNIYYTGQVAGGYCLARVGQKGEHTILTDPNISPDIGDGGPIAFAGVGVPLTDIPSLSVLGPGKLLLNQMAEIGSMYSRLRLFDFDNDLVIPYAGGGEDLNAGIVATTAKFERLNVLGGWNGDAFIIDQRGAGKQTFPAVVHSSTHVLDSWPVPVSSGGQNGAYLPLWPIQYLGPSTRAPDGTFYLLTEMCTPANTCVYRGLSTISPAGEVTYVGGIDQGSTADGAHVTVTDLSGVTSLAFLNGNLYLSDDFYYENGVPKPRLRKLNLVTGIVTTVAGGMPSAPCADYIQAKDASLMWNPGRVNLTSFGNHLLRWESFSTDNSYPVRLRIFWNIE